MGIDTLGHPEAPTSSLGSAEGLGKYFPLNPEQIERAQLLGIGEEALMGIKQRMLSGLNVLNSLKSNRIAYETLLFMTQGVKNTDLPEDEGINEKVQEVDARKRIEAIKEFFDTSFQEADIHSGTIFIAPYYMGPEHKDRFLYMFGLLFMWKKLGVNHRCFARIPTVSEYDPNNRGNALEKVSKEAMNAWGSFTGYKEGGKHYLYAIGYDGDTAKKIHNSRVIDQKNIPPVFSSLGDIEPKVGVPAPASDISYLEEQYVLFGPIQTHPPYKKVMEAFLRKHKDFFLVNMHERCGWEEGWKYLEKLQIEASVPQLKGVSVPVKKTPPSRIRKTPPALRPSHSGPELPSVSAIKKSPEIAKGFPSPGIYGGFQNILSGGNSFERITELTATNLPEGALLWIWGGPGVGWEKYARGELIKIEKITEKTEFIFVFGDTQSTPSTIEGDDFPQTRITVTPRNPKPATTGTEGGEGKHFRNPDIHSLAGSTGAGVARHSDHIRTQVEEITLPTEAISLQTGTDSIPDRTLDVALEIMEIMEKKGDGSIISFGGAFSGYILGIFMVEPLIRFSINIAENSIHLSADNTSGIELAEIEKELLPALPPFISAMKELRESTLLNQLEGLHSRVKQVLSALIEEKTSSASEETIEVSDLLFTSRIQDRYGGDIFKSPLHPGKFSALQSVFSSYGIEINLVDDWSTRGKNYNLELVCRKEDGPNIVYKASRKEDVPYFVLSRNQEIESASLDRALGQITTDAYLLIALMGRLVYEEQVLKEKLKGGKKGYSFAQIEAMIAGTYKRENTGKIPLSPSEKSLIDKAVVRVKNGGLKISKGYVSDIKSGVIIPEIHTARGILEFHKLEETDDIVLTDERLTCIDDEQARVIEAGWKGKRRSHPYSATYAILQSHKRSQKYFIRRMVATVKNESFLGLSPFSNRMQSFFLTFWRNLDTATQEQFMLAVAGPDGHAGKGLEVKLPESDISLFQRFIEEAEGAKIPILYQRPKTITKEDLLNYIASEDYKNWLRMLTSDVINIGEIRGK
ncbi:MAG: hypothetical protein HHAS10_00430 [Candidatus Altimarinota bacterium]